LTLSETSDDNADNNERLIEYIARLSVEDKELIHDLPLEVEELLLLDGDDFCRLTDKRLSDLNEQQQERRVAIIRRISALQAWERVYEEGRKHRHNCKFDNDNGKAKKQKQKSKSKSEVEEQQHEQKEKEYAERIDAISKSISSSEEWQIKLNEKYQTLYDTVQKNLPSLWHSLEFDLSIKNILHIKDCTLPFAGIVLGKPSSLKTIGIEMFRKSRHTFYTDKFSSKSFVSHSTGVSKEQLVTIDLLPKIKNNCFLTPELAPVFAARDEDLIEVLGTLTRVLDGHGYESDSGAHGHRGYNEQMMFVWIGAAVDIPFKVHKLLTTLGPKLYFLSSKSVTKIR
jgi:hypothetical protein